MRFPKDFFSMLLCKIQSSKTIFQISAWSLPIILVGVPSQHCIFEFLDLLTVSLPFCLSYVLIATSFVKLNPLLWDDLLQFSCDSPLINYGPYLAPHSLRFTVLVLGSLIALVTCLPCSLMQGVGYYILAASPSCFIHVIENVTTHVVVVTLCHCCRINVNIHVYMTPTKWNLRSYCPFSYRRVNKMRFALPSLVWRSTGYSFETMKL